MRTAKRALLALVLLTTTVAHAQPGAMVEQPCPTTPTLAEAQIMFGRQLDGVYDPIQRRGAVDILVPLTIHVIRRSDGTGGLSVGQVQQAIDGANEYWQSSGMQFCVPGSTMFHDDNELFNNTDTISKVNTLRELDSVPDTINVYFVNNMRTELGSLCGISSFTTSAVQGIAVSNSCVPSAGNPSTFPHELGHYFDLYHTHEGAFGDECTDGSNSLVAGDLVADTPADPNVRGEVPPETCVWNGSDIPVCGEPVYVPPVLNAMSYSYKTCRTALTSEQGSRALATLINLRPELVANGCDPCPNPADVNDDGLLTPADFSAWIAAFNANDPVADQNGDDTVTPADFTAWIANYNLGC